MQNEGEQGIGRKLLVLLSNSKPNLFTKKNRAFKKWVEKRTEFAGELKKFPLAEQIQINLE